MKWSDSGSGIYEQPPIGTHAARCVRIIDIGTQSGEYQGKPTHKRQCIISWELPTELMAEGDSAGKPFLVSKFYTASLHENANLRADLANWRGREFTPEELGGFDSKNILGKCCMLSLTMNDKGKVRVTGVMALPKSMPVPEQINPSLYFSLDTFDEVAFEKIGEGIKKMIVASPEFQALQKRAQPAKPAGDGAFDDMDDDLPF